MEAIGRYELLERIGRGSMGVLWRGRDTLLEREVAVKVMSTDFAGDDAAKVRFFREARAAARLQHSNIVTVFEFAEHDGVPYFVMEFLRGRSLSTRMAEAVPLSLTQKLGIVGQLCAGLEFAHTEGVVHRDIKPRNIWLCDDGTVKLLDFGIATAGAAALTKYGDVVATPSYMSPEQVAGRDVDGRSDLFAVGVVLYELLSGKKPFNGDSPTGVMLAIVNKPTPPLVLPDPAYPEVLPRIVARALAKDPAERYQRASHLAAELEAARQASLAVVDQPTAYDLSGTTLPAKPSPVPRPPRRTPADMVRDLKLEEIAARAADRVRTFHRDRVRPLRDRLVVWRNLRWAAVGGLLLIAGAVTVAAWPSLMRGSGPPPPPSGSSLATSNPGTDSTSGKPDESSRSVLRAVMISSNPDGATVLIGGKRRQTPVSIDVDPAHLASIQVMKEGYATFERTLTMSDLDAGSLVATLTALPSVSATFAGEYPFELVDASGRVISALKRSHTVSVTGRRAIRIRAPGVFLDRSVLVDAERGPREFHAPALGSLLIRPGPAFESCEALLDGLRVGSFPLDMLEVAVGRHTVLVKCPNGTSRTEQAEVKRGEITRLNLI